METTNLREQLKAEALANAESDLQTAVEWFPLEDQAARLSCANSAENGSCFVPEGH
jgi:hypothetical protein